MERIRRQLLSSHESDDRLGLSLPTDYLTATDRSQPGININEITFNHFCSLPLFFRIKVIARRVEANGSSSVLLRWLPENV